jgi:hypothetical protein
MASFDYTAKIEVFLSRHKKWQTPAHNYRRFASAAEGIRFIIEELPSERFRGTYVKIGDDRLDHIKISELYNHPDYPLARHAPAA